MEVTTEVEASETGVPNQSPLPAGWRHVRLTEVARLESGHTPSKRRPEYWGGTIPWVSLHDTEGLDAWEIQATNQSITEAGLANSSARLLPRGTVVFSRTATVGKSTVMGCSMATSQDFACYVCGPEVHNFYLALLLRSMRTEWKKLMAGSIHNTVYMPVFKTLAVDLPPHDEQVAIANAMLDVERMIDSLEQLLTKKRQIKQGAMQELLTGQRRLPGLIGPWEIHELRNLGQVVRGVAYNPDADLADGDTDQTVRLLRSNNVQGGEIVRIGLQFVNKRRVRNDQYLQDGDLLLCMANGSRDLVGKAGRFVGIDEHRYTFGAFMSCFRPDPASVAPEFVAFLFQTHAFRQHVDLLLAGSSINNLRPEGVLGFTASVPSEHSEQIAIARALGDIDTDITALESRLTKARALKQAMAQALLTGRIRLVESAA